MTPPVIGLLGKKRSGKDSVAARLVDRWGFARYAFADPLKRAAVRLNPWVRIEADEEHLFGSPLGLPVGLHFERLASIVERIGWERAKEIREVRRFLQDHGVAMREEVDESIWLRATLDRVEREDRPVVITDVRFPNEADGVEALPSGLLCRVTRPGLVSTDQHVSETALDDRETLFQISNSSTLEALAAAADSLARVTL